MKVGNETNLLNNEISFDDRAKELLEQDKKKQEAEKRVKNSPYDSWMQVNKKAWKEEDALMRKNILAYRILRFLAQHMDNYNAVMCSYKVFEEYFEVSKATVQRAISILKEYQYLTVLKSGASNVYVINANLFWSSWGSNVKYAKFKANIILSETEQDKKTQEQIRINAERLKQLSLHEEQA